MFLVIHCKTHDIDKHFRINRKQAVDGLSLTMAKELVLILFFLDISCRMSSSSPGKSLLNQTRFHLTQVPSGTGVCAIDNSPQIVSAESSLECSVACQNQLKCNNFNYLSSKRMCQVFTFTPLCYDQVASCRHYHRTTIQPFLGIPAENCSLPFTYKTMLYMSCALNITGVACNFGCLTSNRTAITCQRQTSDFTATYTTKNMSVPNSGFMMLLSVNNWIVIQQRIDNSINFTLNWATYKSGFGNIYSNSWLGLERMHQLTSNAQYRLRVEIQSVNQGKWASAEYETFLISSEITGYAISVSGYVGDAGDAFQNKKNYSSMCYHNGMKFSTIEVDNDLTNDTNCAVAKGGGGWWYNACSYCNLNNPIGNSRFYWLAMVDEGIDSTGILRESRMMIRRV